MHLYLQLHPERTLILAASSHALLFTRAPPSAVSVSLLPLDHVDFSRARKLAHGHGCLGLLVLANDTFLALVTAHTPLGNVLPNEPVSRLVSVDFYCLTSSSFDDPPDASSDPAYSFSSYDPDYSYDPAVLDSSSSPSPSLSSPPSASATPVYTNPTAPIRKILSSGLFYFSSSFDLSTRLEARIRRGDLPGCPTATFDRRFLWNRHLISCLLQFRQDLSDHDRDILDTNGFLVLLIHGFVATTPLSISPSYSSNASNTSLSIISRLSCNRAGTRFNTRGIDDNGDVANFVETELILHAPQFGLYSHIQLRGSIPLFWDQAPASIASPLTLRVSLTRPPVASKLAFDLHFASLIEEYGHVDILSLLGSREGENILEAAYKEHLRNSSMFSESPQSDRPAMCEFDLRAKERIYGYDAIRDLLQREPPIARQLDGMSHCFVVCDPDVHSSSSLSSSSSSLSLSSSSSPSPSPSPSYLRNIVYGQKSVFRVNCLDCLDRTNVTQDMLSQLTLAEFLKTIPLEIPGSVIWNAHRTLWAENGDALSRIYAGTGALNTSFTRTGRKTLAGVLSDATKSVSRMYQSNFNDRSKQYAIDSLLGQLASQPGPAQIFNPIRAAVQEQLNQRSDHFSSSKHIKIWAGTFNLNGYSFPGQQSIEPWVFPTPSDGDPDIYAFGFQEIVQLTPGQIVTTDPAKKARWEQTIMKTLENRKPKIGAEKPSNPDGSSPPTYVMLRSEQLVGTALILVVRMDLVSSIKNVEASTKKTGFRGMAGNKGGVAIRLDLYDTSICFITSHFAAGSSNTDERNMDYYTISQGLHFLRGKKIESHDQVVWLGDLNYRVDLPNEEVRTLAAGGGVNNTNSNGNASVDSEWSRLLAFDQLLRARETNGIFDGYRESTITFRPTYKYDTGTNTFDSSEKQRTPSWTDRILIRGSDIDLTWYSSADVRFSDHRPVFALIRSKIRIIDKQKRDAIAESIFEQLSSLSSTTTPSSSSSSSNNNNKSVPNVSKLYINNKNSILDQNGKREKKLSPIPSTSASASALDGDELSLTPGEHPEWWKVVDGASDSLDAAQVESLASKRNTEVSNPFDNNAFIDNNNIIVDDKNSTPSDIGKLKLMRQQGTRTSTSTSTSTSASTSTSESSSLATSPILCSSSLTAASTKSILDEDVEDDNGLSSATAGRAGAGERNTTKSSDLWTVISPTSVHK